MRRAMIVGAVLGVSGTAYSGTGTGTGTVRAVYTDTHEARACLPIGGGDTLVGTGGGLVRVDEKGAARGTWTATDGLPGTRVDALVAGDDDHAWVATDGGVAEIAAGDDGDVTLVRAIATRPARDVVRVGAVVYVATWDGGVVTLTTRAGKTTATAVAMKGGARASRARASSLAVVGDTVYAGTEAGLYALARGTFTRIDPHAVTDLESDGARLWIGAADGLFVKDDAGAAVRAIGGGEVRHLAMIDGALVVAGPDGLATVTRDHLGGWRGAPRTGLALTVAAAHGARCAGGPGGLWLDSAADAPWLHAAATAGPPSNDISALAVDGDRLYVGTFDQGVAILERGAWRTLDDAAIDRRVNAILIDRRDHAAGRVWIGTAAGLAVIEGGATRTITRRDGLPGRNVLSLARLADGRIVAGTSQGAAFVDGARPARVGPRGEGASGAGNVWAIAEAPAGTLWLGTTTGLYRGAAIAWTTKDGADDPAALPTAWARLSVATGHLPDDWVTSLAVAGETIYAGTYNGGIARLDHHASGDAYVSTELGGGWINPAGVVVDDRRVLAATMDGLRVTDDSAWTTARGLPGKDTTAIAAQGRTLWIATRRGLARLDR